MNLDFSGKTVLVTGASRGIGAAIAEAFGDAGAFVGVHCGRETAKADAIAARFGDRAAVFQADLSRLEDCERLWGEALDCFGRIDVLVNNAGVAIGSPPDEPVTRWLADWETTMAVNLTATALLSRAAVAHFQTAGGGRIVNIASRAAFRGDTPDYLAYAASKGGMVALTRSIARGYGKDGVTAFVVAPGFTRTEMAQDFIDQYGEDFAMKDVALSRMTEPKDIAPTVLFLASGLADHATGSTIDINAGSYVR
ncbi:MAG TPA: SDR family oxidoreductase [Caulobacteraceae bacterium]|jgi:NAD(P)-dependent dehydrogenase (short-subunit alcohol dehydrogenase family)|nr:SDR family oxidoreductase [Caulobacteraceae bacterium]